MSGVEEDSVNVFSEIGLAGATTELAAMQTIAEALNPLDEGARKRVFHWAQDFFNFEKNGSVSAMPLARSFEKPTFDESDNSFETFGELYSAIDPLTQEDKALTAAYWLQVIQGRESWQSADIQKELRELGYALSNVADSVSSAVNKRPQRVIQLKKSGSSRQARKTFKLSDAGKKYVEERLTHHTLSES